jgi:hypothetical protein
MMKTTRIILGIFLAAALIICISSCSTEHKIQKAIETLKNNDRLDDACAENFPVISHIDDSAYKRTKQYADSLASAIVQEQEHRQFDRMIYEDQLNDLRNDQGLSCDSMNEELYRFAAKQIKRVDSLHAIIDSKDSKVRELQKAVSNLKPVISHERDTAAEAVLTDKLNQVTAERDKWQDKSDELKKQYDDHMKKHKGHVAIYIPWWLIIIAMIAVAGSVFSKIKLGSFNPLSIFKLLT